VKAVIDEGVPEDLVEPLRRLGAAVHPFEPAWRGFANGVLLTAVEKAGYSLLITNDKNLGFQLNLRRLRLAIVALPINRLDILIARSADILSSIQSAKLGQVLSIGLDGRRLVRSADSAGTIITDELPRLSPFRA
jgi:hypothetical protein